MKKYLIPLLFIPLLASCSTDTNVSPSDSPSEDTTSEDTTILPKPIIDEESQTIEYGIYPNEHINDENLIASLDAIDAPLENGYYLYNGEYYAKSAGLTWNTWDSAPQFLDGTSLEKNVQYWFKCTPIKWRILEHDVEKDEYLLLCDKAIDTYKFLSHTNNRTIDDKNVTPNNYKYSEIREFLNDAFYEKAFIEGDDYLLTKEVDNSTATQYNPNYDNPYTCENTMDTIFLPSYQDLIKEEYGFGDGTISNDSRKAKYTDYSVATGAYIGVSTNKTAKYWARSPYQSSGRDVMYVTTDGRITQYGQTVTSIETTIRPMIWLTTTLN